MPDHTDRQTQSARYLAEAIALCQEQADIAQRFCKDRIPEFKNLASSIAEIQSHAIALVAVLRSLPVLEQQQLRAFIETLPALFGPAILAEISAALRAAGISAPHVPQGETFRQVVGKFFSDLQTSLVTLMSTRMGGPGRVRYRALSNIGGGRSGLSLRSGDVVALNPDDEMTRKLLASRAIEQVAA
jgi:hypothetical protein